MYLRKLECRGLSFIYNTQNQSVQIVDLSQMHEYLEVESESAYVR